jgi:hypothetical protein
MDKLKQKRLSQLDKEEDIDIALLQNYTQCSNTIFEYLLKAREVNRNLTRELYAHSSIFQSYNSYLKVLKGTDKIQNIDTKRDLCSQLLDTLSIKL